MIDSVDSRRDLAARLLGISNATAAFDPGRRRLLGTAGMAISGALLGPSLSGCGGPAGHDASSAWDATGRRDSVPAHQYESGFRVGHHRPERWRHVEPSLTELFSVRNVLDRVTVAGAKSHGLVDKIGTLNVGKQADAIMLKTREINVGPINDPFGSIVLGMDSSNVDAVFVAGKAMNRGGVLVGWPPCRRRPQNGAASWPR